MSEMKAAPDWSGNGNNSNTPSGVPEVDDTIETSIPEVSEPAVNPVGASMISEEQKVATGQSGRQTGNEKSYIYSRKPDFICPFCMREIYTGDLLYFCKRCGKMYTEEEAKEQLSRVVKRQYYCCNDNITSSRICPNCRIEKENGRIKNDLRMLPSEVYRIKNEFRVCMTGYSASGKTQYITQLMDYIAKYSLPGIDSTYFLDNETQNIREAIRHKFFEQRSIAGTASGYLEPLLFNIHKGKHSYVSVFYDIAGEDFRENRDTLATRCIWNSKNVLLVIDPTTLPDLDLEKNQKLKEFKASQGKASTGEVTEPLNTYLNFVRGKHPNGEKFLKKVNLAIVFPKMDLFYEEEDFPESLKKESSHIAKGKFDVEEVTAVSQAMERWLRSKGGNALLSAIRGYSNIQIFGVSSGSLEEQKQPNRLLDPYLWLLYRNDIFK